MAYGLRRRALRNCTRTLRLVQRQDRRLHKDISAPGGLPQVPLPGSRLHAPGHSRTQCGPRCSREGVARGLGLRGRVSRRLRAGGFAGTEHQ